MSGCEWCDKLQTWRWDGPGDYVRFSCDEHVDKTARLVHLDLGKHVEAQRIDWEDDDDA